MLKRILFMMISVFSLMLNSAVMAEEYDYTVFRDVDGVPVAVDNPQSCSTFFDIGQGEDITMTPVFRRVCETGYYDKGGLVSLEDISSNPDTCVLIAKSCDPGEYLDFSDNEPICKECPVGYWCPSRYLSVQTVNETVCGDVNNVAEGGMTEENKDYNWKNNRCIDSDGNTVAGIKSESECGFTSIGKCKCPGDTTTRATKQEGFGLNSTSIDACAYYDLEPGEQLKRSADTEHNYQWENGKCVDKDNNDEEVAGIKSSVYCGYKYEKTLCDEDNFCLGGVFTVAKYKDSMNACPDKYNDVVTIETESDCNTAKSNGFEWKDEECVIKTTTIKISNITTSTACDHANAIKSDLVWNSAEGKCLLKGHAEAGSFRCSYTCPAGYYMHVVNQYDTNLHSHNINDYYISKYFLGGWRAYLTTCEPCPEGSFCEGDTFFSDTKYDEDTYSDEQSKYYSNGEKFGISECDTGLTMGIGSYSADQCKKFCEAGYYYSAAEGECRPCAEKQGLDETWYCPGGVVYDDNANEDVGISTCEQQNVMIIDLTLKDTQLLSSDDRDRNNYITPNDTKTACACPEGYEWNSTTRACCEPNKACCGAGLELRTYSDGTYECKPCGSGNADVDCDLICSSADDQSTDCLACRNKTYCPGTILKIYEHCKLGKNQYRGADNGCYDCGVGAVPGGYDEDKGEYTSCICDLEEMKKHGEQFGELADNPNLFVRHWNGSACELDTYYVGVSYSNIDLAGSIHTHGVSSCNSGPCDYWSKYYRYGQVKNTNGDYVEADSFTIEWNPTERGYNFLNPVTPEEGLENPESMSARKVKDGYVFAGWCRGTDFCCPAGYKMHGVENGKKECVICQNGDTDDCSGSAWMAPNAKLTINTKAAENRIAPTSFKYYAMLIADTVCDKGEFLNTTTMKCEDCPAGYYCTGGVVSPRQPGRYPCEPGTYREYTKGTQLEYVPDTESGSYDGCKPCAAGVSEELSRQYGADIQVPDDNGLVTLISAATSLDKCGYYCEETHYDAEDNKFKCDKQCEAGSYCPAAGPVPGYSKYQRVFFDWKHQGEGMLPCPTGLNSDAGARQCYTDPGCKANHYNWENGKCINEATNDVISSIATELDCIDGGYKWEKGRCIDEDTNKEIVGVSESECVYTGYYKKKNADGDYECIKCGENNPSTDSYYYCPGFEKENVNLMDYTTNHEDSVGRYECRENPVTHIKTISDDNSEHCYDLANAGKYIDPATGLPELCKENHFCTGKEEIGTGGQKECPAGSVSNIGAQFITDCHCVYGEDYRPDGVYYEKGAELVQYGQTLNDFACVNTYLVVGNTASYNTATEDSIPNAKAKVVSCRWVNNDQNVDASGAPNGKYSNCTERALDICYKSDWEQSVVSESVSTSDVLKLLAKSLYAEPEQQTAQYAIDHLVKVSNIKNIPSVDNWKKCQTSLLCVNGGFVHFDEIIDACYADITYLNIYDEDVTWPENSEECSITPSKYTSDDLPITLCNPERAHYEFDGWCLNGETEEDCLGNNAIVYDEEGKIVTFSKRTIPQGTTGDLEFVAKWQMVCPYGYVNHDAELTDVTQCYAVVEFDSNKSGVDSPANHIEQYSEGATTYTLATLPELSVTGYNFGGWYDNSATNGRDVTSDTELLGDYKLYAKWSPINYTVVFNGNGSTSGEMANQSFDYDENKSLNTNTFTKTGYTFNGWCDALNNETGVCADNANSYSDGQTVYNLTAEDNKLVNLYAKWNLEEYGIIYNGIENASLSAENPHSYNVESATITLNNPTKSGHVFLGWCDDADFTQCSTTKTIEQGSTGNRIFWAKWVAVGCAEDFPEETAGNCYATITYNNVEDATLPAGVSNPDRYTAEMVAEHPIQLPVPTRTNYAFLGWYSNAEFTGETVEKVPVASTGNKQFWAKWEHVCETGKYLHIGDNAVCLYATKPSTGPSLVVKISDKKYYAYMCTNCTKTMNGGTDAKLHIRYNNKTYNVHDLTARQ